MTEKAMFEDAQVGDRVWDYRYGFGEIATVDPSSNYPLKVKFPSVGGSRTYTLDGKHYSNEVFISLFWDEIKFDIPPRPKRKVKKVIEGWVGMYPPTGNHPVQIVVTMYGTEEEAIEYAGCGCLGQYHIVFEYKEEE